jgi:hypothetical protein
MAPLSVFGLSKMELVMHWFKGFAAVLAALTISSSAIAQSGSVTSNAFVVGKGPGKTGFSSVLCGLAQIPIGQTSANPACAALTGDVTMTGAGVTAIGANKVTNAMLATMAANTTKCNATAGVAAPTDCNAATMRTNLALVIGTNVQAWDADLDALAALSGTGIIRRTGTSTFSNGTAVLNAELSTMTANTVKANATSGAAVPTDLAVPSCSTASSALTWTTNTGFGCNSIAGGGSGAWSNSRLAKTTAYTTVTGDCGATIAMGGSASFPVTFNAPSGYSSSCAFLALNEDTANGKLIVPQMATSATSFLIGTGSKAFTTTAGLPIKVYNTAGSAQRYRVYSLANPANYMVGTVTAYATTTLTILVDGVGGSGTFTDWQIAPEIRLWPGQSRWIFNQNNVWTMDNPQRWKLPAETEICVDAVSGNDSNDGLGTGTRCFQHIQFASNVVYQDWDANNFPPDIGLYTGPFNESVTIQGQLTGYNFLRYRTRAANTWTNTAFCIGVSDNAEAIFDAIFGFTQTWQCNTSNGANTGAIYGHQVSVIDIGGAHKWISGGTADSFLFEDGEGRATINGTGAGIILGNTGTTSGFAYVVCNYHCGGVTTGGTLSWGGTISLAGFYVAKGGSVIDHSANPTGTPGTIGVALSLGNSVIRLNGLTPPGGTPTASFQGVCATTC